ncbi:MAG: aminopeptidase N [Proteobacteria bacterium]|nr:aminopeptidase N [Pseudomonadota bacterium]
MEQTSLQPVLLKEYTPSIYKIPKIDLKIMVESDFTEVHATLLVEKNIQTKTTEDLRLNGESLELIEVKLNGRILEPSEYQQTEHALIIHSPGDSFTIETAVRIYPEKNTQLMGLYASKYGYFTQCEAEGFRRITFSLDRPDVLSQFTTHIQAPKDKYPVLLSNGNLTTSGELTDGLHFALWTDPHPKPSYLFAIVLGRLDKKEERFITSSGRTVALQIYAPQHQIEQTTFAMEALKRSMRWDEERFKLEVDLDQYMIVAVDDFNMGAMENKGLNIFNTKYILANQSLSTDRDFMLLDRVVAHEYFHNWTGNRVTCRDWFQLSLKEGLTVFRDQEYGADTYSRGVQRIQEVRSLRTTQFPEDAGPMAHPIRPDAYVEINNFYTATIYDKGAEIVRMIHTLVGEDNFQRGMKVYFERHDGCAVTTEEFVSAMEHASGADLSRFRNWYVQAGTPRVKITSTYDAMTQTYTLECQQYFAEEKFKSNQPAHIPIKLKLFQPNGASSKEQIVSLKDSRDSFSFTQVTERPIPSLFREFSAPIILDFEYTDEDLLYLLAHDDDPFNRWEAGQQLQSRLILSAIPKLEGRLQPSWNNNFIEVLSESLHEAHEDPAFTAELFSTPAESHLAESLELVDPDLLHSARNALRLTIAPTLEAQLLDVYLKQSNQASYSPDARSAGQRAIKNVCLGLLVDLKKQEYVDLSLRQLETATNMTDEYAALQIIVNATRPECEEALIKFYDKWRSEPLALDKWFAVQAASPSKNTAERVKELMTHPTFDIKNPNKVFALLRTFSANHVHFHRSDGFGYRLISEAILELDAINPQVAARISRSFDRWQKFDKAHQSHAKSALETIINQPKLSKDTGEIISKTLRG